MIMGWRAVMSGAWAGRARCGSDSLKVAGIEASGALPSVLMAHEGKGRHPGSLEAWKDCGQCIGQRIEQRRATHVILTQEIGDKAFVEDAAC